MKIRIKDTKQLKDSIDFYRKKIRDAEIEHPDLTKKGVKSIANDLLAEKDRIDAAQGFAELAKIMKEVVSKTDTPKAKEILFKIGDLEKLYNRRPVPGSQNDYWCWEKLLKYCYNIILRASNNPSPDVKPEQKENDVTEDSTKVKDEDDAMESLKEVIKVLGEAHDKIMEALDLVESLENDDKVSSQLRYDLEDLEAEASDFDFNGESDPVKKLLEKYGSEEIETIDVDDCYDFGK